MKYCWPRLGLRLLALLLLLTVSLAARPPLQVGAQERNRAGLIVDFGEGRVFTACIRFAEDELSGVDLLRRAGLDLLVEYSSIGQAVCKIEDVGCAFPGQHCFCDCLRVPCAYWSYWYRDGDSWIYSGMGGSDRRVGDGGVDAWVWGDGSRQPPELDLASLCAAPPEEDTPTPPPDGPVTGLPTGEASPPVPSPSPSERTAAAGRRWPTSPRPRPSPRMPPRTQRRVQQSGALGSRTMAPSWRSPAYWRC